MIHTIQPIQPRVRELAGALAAATAAYLALRAGVDAEVVKKAAGVGSNSDLGKFVKASDALIDPAIVAMAAIAPLACLAGAGAMMFGSRKGLLIVGAALGTLVFVASIKGIVA